MKIPFKPYKAEDSDIFTVDAIHQKYWNEFCDICYPHFGFENDEDYERSYEQKYETFRQCHNMINDYFGWKEVLLFKVTEDDLKRFKRAYLLFTSLTTDDNATIPMLLVLLRMQQSIWNRLREDRRMMEYVYPRNYFLNHSNYEQFELGTIEDLPSDEHVISNIQELEKQLCEDLTKERKWDERWIREIEDFCGNNSDDNKILSTTVGDLANRLTWHILGSYNYALHESLTKFECNIVKGSGDVIKPIIFRLFMTYQCSLPRVKTFFDDYPAHICMNKMEKARDELIEDFKQTKLGAHWCECMMLPEGLEKVGRFLINHRDSISEEEEYHFFYLLDEICIMTDIIQGNISKYWLNVDFCETEIVDKKLKEVKEVLDEVPESQQPLLEGEVKEIDKTNIKKCFNFSNDFIKQQVEAVVKEFYKGAHTELALIEVVLYDHGQLKKRNSHTAFIKSLIDWGIISVSEDDKRRQIISGVTDKYKRLPDTGYMDWNSDLINEKNLCIRIGEKLDKSMKYLR